MKAGRELSTADLRMLLSEAAAAAAAAAAAEAPEAPEAPAAEAASGWGWEIASCTFYSLWASCPCPKDSYFYLPSSKVSDFNIPLDSIMLSSSGGSNNIGNQEWTAPGTPPASNTALD